MLQLSPVRFGKSTPPSSRPPCNRFEKVGQIVNRGALQVAESERRNRVPTSTARATPSVLTVSRGAVSDCSSTHTACSWPSRTRVDEIDLRAVHRSMPQPAPTYARTGRICPDMLLARRASRHLQRCVSSMVDIWRVQEIKSAFRRVIGTRKAVPRLALSTCRREPRRTCRVVRGQSRGIPSQIAKLGLTHFLSSS